MRRGRRRTGGSQHSGKGHNACANVVNLTVVSVEHLHVAEYSLGRPRMPAKQRKISVVLEGRGGATEQFELRVGDRTEETTPVPTTATSEVAEACLAWSDSGLHTMRGT
jgi:hypothetical protein